MSGIVLPNLDLSTAVIGARTLYDQSSILQANINPLQVQKYGPPQLQLYNESPVGLQIQLSQSLKTYNLPAGAWAKIAVDPDDKGFYWTPQYILLTPAAVNLLLVTWLAPGDPGTDIVVLGNSPINGGVVVTSSTAQFLQGISQLLPLTEVDDVSGFPTIGPANGASIGTGIGARDVGNVYRTIGEFQADGSIEFTVRKFDGSGNFGSVEGQDFYAGGAVKLLDSVFTAGLTGVAGVFAKTIVTGIVSTANQVIFTFAPTLTGMYRINVMFRLNNGTSGQLVTCQVVYASGFTGLSATNSLLVTSSGLGPTRTDGTISMNNSAQYAGGTPFYAQAGTNIVLNYRDPANTPNDSIAAYLEFLG